MRPAIHINNEMRGQGVCVCVCWETAKRRLLTSARRARPHRRLTLRYLISTRRSIGDMYSGGCRRKRGAESWRPLKSTPPPYSGRRRDAHHLADVDPEKAHHHTAKKRARCSDFKVQETTPQSP